MDIQEFTTTFENAAREWHQGYAEQLTRALNRVDAEFEPIMSVLTAAAGVLKNLATGSSIEIPDRWTIIEDGPSLAMSVEVERVDGEDFRLTFNYDGDVFAIQGLPGQASDWLEWGAPEAFAETLGDFLIRFFSDGEEGEM